ncbi:MAG TPA: DNA-3-methyladenine glycosylase I [Anaerolineae bacterium]|nr:DNA-3-methyladenine glycosylase I [Anaerolineae bacterium]
MNRCAWTGANVLVMAYHDTEWGVPLHDEQKLFEFLVLEGMQAGLSWSTILNKRENFRAAFHHFDVARVARYTPHDVERLLQDAGIIRNRLKIEATINNARRFIEVQSEFGSFNAYIWRFVEGQPIKNAWRSMKEIPPKTPLSDAVSKDLLKRGFKFVGSTIVYAHMQATGMVNDHTVDCFRYEEVGK